MTEQHPVDYDAPRVYADLAALIRDYLTNEAQIDSPSFHATSIAYRIAAAGYCVYPPGVVDVATTPTAP